MLLPRAQMGSEDGVATTGSAMDHKQDGVAFILSADRYPLVNAPDADEAFFHDALSTLDPKCRRHPRLLNLSVNEKCRKHTHNHRRQGCARNPKHRFLQTVYSIHSYDACTRRIAETKQYAVDGGDKTKKCRLKQSTW